MKARLQPAEDKHKDFPAWGLHVPEWAAGGMKGSPVYGPRAEWEGTLNPARPHLPSFSTGHLLPHLCFCSSPEPEGPRLPGWALSAAPSNFWRHAPEKGMRAKRLSIRVTVSVRAIYGSCGAHSEVFWVS